MTLIRINNNNNHLWCLECKERIRIGQKFIIVQEVIYNNEVIDKTYHPECVPAEPDEDDVYISPEQE